MPRAPLTMEQRRDYRLLDFKAWVSGQMKVNHLLQKDVADALGISQVRVSQMLDTPDKRKKRKRHREKEGKIEPDPFSLGQVITLFELFETDPEERKRLLTL